MQNANRYLVTVSLLLLVFGCAPTGRYYQHQDSAPKVVPQKVTTKDAKPIYEVYAPANMRPYTIRGVRYQPLSTGKGFTEKGQASWYGQKFHGHLTSNGEIYDMYQMSAAHKTLPLPTFVRVTNLENDKKVIVRVNDRGPFHSGRVIDLSYAAALKLDVLKHGVADVKLDVIHVDKKGKVTIGRALGPIQEKTVQTKPQIFIQVLALQNKIKIDNLANSLKRLYPHPFKVKFENGIYKLRLGPLKSKREADNLLSKLKKNDYPGAYKIYSH